MIITYRTDPEKLRARGAGAARGRRAAGQIRVHPHAEFHRLRRLYRNRPGHPGLVPGPQGRLHPLHVPQRRAADRRRSRAVGLPEEARQPDAHVEIDTLVGTLDYGPVRVATGTMGYKHQEADLAAVKASLAAPNFLLKIIPHVDGTPRICELVEYSSRGRDAQGRLDQPGRAFADAARARAGRGAAGARGRLRRSHRSATSRSASARSCTTISVEALLQQQEA